MVQFIYVIFFNKTHVHLRTGFYGDLQCAVTILSLPPDPTVMVTPAHCAYQCLDNKNRPVQVRCKNDGVSPVTILSLPPDPTVMVTPANALASA